MSGTDSEEDIRIPRRRRTPLHEDGARKIVKETKCSVYPPEWNDSDDTDSEENIQDILRKKRRRKQRAVTTRDKSPLSTSDEESSCSPGRKRYGKEKAKEEEEAVSTNSVTEYADRGLSELFQNKDIFEENAEEESINEIKSSFSNPVKDGKMKKGKSNASCVSKKEMKKLQSETQKIIRESSVSLPTYEPKRKSFADFLTKLNARKHQQLPKTVKVDTTDTIPEVLPQTTSTIPEVLPQLSSDAEFVVERLPSVIENFQQRIQSQLRCAKRDDDSREDDKPRNGLSWQQLKVTLQSSLGKHRAEEAVRFEEMKHFEENEGMALDEEEAEFTSSDSDSEKDIAEEAPDKDPYKQDKEEVQNDHTEDEIQNNHSGDEIQNDHSGDEIQNDHSGDEIQNDHSGDEVQNNHSGDEIQNDQSGDEIQNNHSGDEVQNNHSGDEIQNDHSGDEVQNNHSGDEIQNDHSGDEVQNDHSGDDVQNSSSDDDKQFHSSGDELGSDGEDGLHTRPQIRKSRVLLSDDESESHDVVSVAEDSMFQLQQNKLSLPYTRATGFGVDSGFDTENMVISVSKSSLSVEGSPAKSMNSSTLMSQDLFSDSLHSESVTFREPKSYMPCVNSMDEETQFLDTQGFLCIREREQPSGIPSALSSLIKDDSQEGNPLETVLGLCSGRFAGVELCSEADSMKQEEGPSTQAVRELLGVTQPVCTSSLTTIFGKGTQGDNGEFDVLALCSGRFPSQAPVGDQSEDEDMPVLKKKRQVIANSKLTKEERLAEFVESEAELSGSDVGSDAEDDPNSELDEYEEDVAGSDVPDSDSELKEQVNRIHMRNIIADDKVDLKQMKERFLAEGDLYEDGMYLKNGFFRKRKFAHQGSEVSMDLFSEDRTLDSGGEDVEEDSDDAAEVTRRRKRVEKEQFLKFIRNGQGSLLEEDEDSQSVLNVLSCAANSNTCFNDSTSTFKRQVSQTHCGSFLKRNRSQLKRLASATSRAPHATEGQKGVVFKFVPSAGDQDNAEVKEPVQKKARTVAAPVRSLSEDSNSVFDVLY